MFRVDQRFIGQGMWNSAALPMTLQAAFGRVTALQDSKFADDVRVMPAHSETSEARLLDLYV